MFWLKILCATTVAGVTLVSGFYPLFQKHQAKSCIHFAWGESLAVGVFLGVGLLHMLHDASERFYAANIHYPFALLLAGGSFLFLLLLEHIGRSIYENQGFGNAFAMLAVFMLSIHSYLAGFALGLAETTSMTLILFLAIIAHKWAESFSLAVQLSKSTLTFNHALSFFILFSLMLPLGMLSSLYLQDILTPTPLIEPSMSALAAGTFIYLGTLHGLERAVLIKQCCNLKAFTLVLLGFILMAVVSIWV